MALLILRLCKKVMPVLRVCDQPCQIMEVDLLASSSICEVCYPMPDYQDVVRMLPGEDAVVLMQNSGGSSSSELDTCRVRELDESEECR